MIRFSLNGEKHEFDDDRITFAEGRAIEVVTGYPFKQFPKKLGAGEMTALQAVIWIALRRDDKTLEFSGLDDLSLADFEFHGEPDPTEGESPS